MARLTLPVLIATFAVAGSVVACSEETPERKRFESAGGEGGTSSGGAGGAASSGGGGQLAAGGAGGSGDQRVCLTDTLTVADLTLTEGDTEFDGNGPVVTMTVDASATPTNVVIEACVQMRETQSDWSTGSRCVQGTVDVPNGGLVSATAFSAEYTDTDTETDNVFNEASSIMLADELVVSAQCVGDTSGADICASSNGDCSMCLFTLGCFVVRSPN